MAILQALAVLITLVRSCLATDCYTRAAVDKSAFPNCEEIAKDQLWIGWKIDGGKITMAVTRKNDGWVSVGIAEEQSAGMKGGDMIVVSKKDGKIIVEDRFAEGYIFPTLDKSQDVELVSSKQENGIFQAVVRRQLKTCDEHDQAIRMHYPHRILYSFGEAGDWTFKHHDMDKRGSAAVDFWPHPESSQWRQKLMADSSVKHLKIHFNNYHIPTGKRPLGYGRFQEGTNQYKCMAVPLRNVTDIKPPFDIVAADPIVGSPFLHHFVNQACKGDPRPDKSKPWGEDLDNDIFDCAMGGGLGGQCSQTPGYAAGGKGYTSPLDSGTRVPEGVTWMLFDTHYYNPSLKKDAFDSSGMDYLITSNLRPNRVASVWMGIDFTMRIPSGQKKASYWQHCPASAVENAFLPGKDTVHLHSLVHHLHMRGSGASTFIVRNGKRIPLVLQQHYDYNFQGRVPLNVTLRRGDALEVLCQYDTTKEPQETRWGERTQDEMCISIIDFSPAPPKMDRLMCMSLTADNPLTKEKKHLVYVNFPGMNKEIAKKVPKQEGFMGASMPASPTFSAMTGCMKPKKSCVPLWSLCKYCAICARDEICTVQGCSKEKPSFCNMCNMCRACYEPPTAEDPICEECENSCEPFISKAPGYLFDMKEVGMSPVADSNGYYDMPFGEPLSPVFSDYECKLPKYVPKPKKDSTGASSTKPLALSLAAFGAVGFLLKL